MDLALRVDIDTTEKENQTSDGEDSSRYYLQVVFHISQKLPKIIQKIGDLTLAAEDEF